MSDTADLSFEFTSSDHDLLVKQLVLLDSVLINVTTSLVWLHLVILNQLISFKSDIPGKLDVNTIGMVHEFAVPQKESAVVDAPDDSSLVPKPAVLIGNDDGVINRQGVAHVVLNRLFIFSVEWVFFVDFVYLDILHLAVGIDNPNMIRVRLNDIPMNLTVIIKNNVSNSIHLILFHGSLWTSHRQGFLANLSCIDVNHLEVARVHLDLSLSTLDLECWHRLVVFINFHDGGFLALIFTVDHSDIVSFLKVFLNHLFFNFEIVCVALDVFGLEHNNLFIFFEIGDNTNDSLQLSRIDKYLILKLQFVRLSVIFSYQELLKVFIGEAVSIIFTRIIIIVILVIF